MEKKEEKLSKLIREFKDGELIFCEYEPGEELYILQSGRVKISSVIDQKEKTLAILEPGSIFGEMAVLDKKPRSATAQAIGDVKVYCINYEGLKIVVKQNPQFAIQLIKMFSQRVWSTNRHIRNLRIKEILVRAADGLLMLAEKSGVSPSSHQRVRLEIKPPEFAKLIGVSIVEGEKVLKRLEKERKIRIEDDGITIPSLSEILRMVEVYKKKERFDIVGE